MKILDSLYELLLYWGYLAFSLKETHIVSRRRLFVLRLMKKRLGLPEIALTEISEKDVILSEPILDDCFLAPYRDHLKHDDFRPLMLIVGGLAPNVVLEFGTAYGNIAANICGQCSSAKIYTVNAPPDLIKNSGITTVEPEVSEIGRAYKKYGYSKRVEQILADTRSINLERYFEAPAIELAIIDANHETMYVVNDFLKIHPYVRPGGVVMLHDTHPSLRGHLVGSYAACMGLRRKGYDIRHIRDTWWGIYFKPLEAEAAT